MVYSRIHRDITGEMWFRVEQRIPGNVVMDFGEGQWFLFIKILTPLFYQ